MSINPRAIALDNRVFTRLDSYYNSLMTLYNTCTYQSCISLQTLVRDRGLENSDL